MNQKLLRQELDWLLSGHEVTIPITLLKYILILSNYIIIIRRMKTSRQPQITFEQITAYDVTIIVESKHENL